jgi:hypothetical protein
MINICGCNTQNKLALIARLRHILTLANCKLERVIAELYDLTNMIRIYGRIAVGHFGRIRKELGTM